MKKWLLPIVLAVELALGVVLAPAMLAQWSRPAAATRTPAIAQPVVNTGTSFAVQPAVAGNTAMADAGVAAALENTMEAIYQGVSPSVVYVEVTSTMSTSSRFGGQRSMQVQGSGSGFVWDKAGDIVTNNHVVDGATAIQVTFSDGTTAPATVVGQDAANDLAVIHVPVAAGKLQPVTLADSSQIKVGQLTIAIGNPFGFEQTLTVGYVSGLGRSLSMDSQSAYGTHYSISDLIQTDAPINPGNSGGVLLDRNGDVIGVTNAIASSSGSSSGVGFAIPSATVAKVIPGLLSAGTAS